MIYSRVLVSRFLRILWISILLLFCIISLSTLLQIDEITGGPYVPKEKVTRISALIKELRDSGTTINYESSYREENKINGNGLVGFINRLTCSQRVKNIVYFSSMKILKNYPAMTEEQYIDSLRKHYFPFFQNKCMGGIDD